MNRSSKRLSRAGGNPSASPDFTAIVLDSRLRGKDESIAAVIGDRRKMLHSIALSGQQTD